MTKSGKGIIGNLDSNEIDELNKSMLEYLKLSR